MRLIILNVINVQLIIHLIETFMNDAFIMITGEKITPLVCNPGKVLLTSSRLYFQPFNNVEPVCYY